jgi:hypothetical protein
MKITKRQLRRIIKEAMPDGGAPDIVGYLNPHVRDRAGNIDDFRAPPGQVGSALARRIGVESQLLQDMSRTLRGLKNAGYDREDIEAAVMNVIEMFFTGKR